MTFRAKLRAAAAHFRCKASPESVRAACRQRADEICAAHGNDLRPEERLLALANHYSVELEVAATTEDLETFIKAHVAQGDHGFALRRERFDDDLLACIMRRGRPHGADRRFVALIDARERKAPTAFFSKSHEVAHPALEPQLQFEFRDEAKKTTPWERFVDQVGADCVFAGAPWEHAVGALEHDGLTIAGVEEVRRLLVPEASLTAVALAIGNTLSQPLFVVWAVLGTSKSDDSSVLRLRSVTPNHLAAAREYHLPRNYRVPVSSPLSKAFFSDNDCAGIECLSTWTSSRSALPAQTVWTSGSARGDGVLGILVHR